MTSLTRPRPTVQTTVFTFINCRSKRKWTKHCEEDLHRSPQMSGVEKDTLVEITRKYENNTENKRMNSLDMRLVLYVSQSDVLSCWASHKRPCRQ